MRGRRCETQWFLAKPLTEFWARASSIQSEGIIEMTQSRHTQYQDIAIMGDWSLASNEGDGQKDAPLKDEIMNRGLSG